MKRDYFKLKKKFKKIKSKNKMEYNNLLPPTFIKNTVHEIEENKDDNDIKHNIKQFIKSIIQKKIKKLKKKNK